MLKPLYHDECPQANQPKAREQNSSEPTILAIIYPAHPDQVLTLHFELSKHSQHLLPNRHDPHLSPSSRHLYPAQVSGFYFRPCRDDHDEVILEYFRCRCGTVRKQTRRNGYSNLMQHVRREHPDYEAIMLAASTAETGSMLSYNNLPLSFCENRAARSVARTTFGQERHSLQSIALEMILFLRQNAGYWNAQTVDDATQ
ncbi:Bidirectional sugar transporter SWEET15 [Phytophthora nicotianae]|uniref:Bidirectional sugar transporter SWEET15 n=1 Tax=Phytophthora nicotianae TaxID=4792 RepID=A0A0W8DFP7_PHYNI|nr:Bidirectional sugar transporter SWEET15 [Phytophthora nicotianae]